MKNLSTTVLFTAILVAGCTFDKSGTAASPDAGTSDDPADDFVCETDRSCQEVGFGCNKYSCTDESECVVTDTLCESGEVCTMDGCAEAPVATCENHSDCVPVEGCESAYCTEAGTCESYSCGASLCSTDDDCQSDEECDDQGHCVPAPECTVDADCTGHVWSCMAADCSSVGTCGFTDTCPSDQYCTADGCKSGGDVGSLNIHCDNVDGVTVTFSGAINLGIVTSGVGDLPGTPGKVSIAGNRGIGSGAYWPSTSSGIDTSHPATEVTETGGFWFVSGTLVFGDSVQEFQFVVANAANTALRYFDLSKWTVTGYCAKDSTGGLLCSCETLPCVCD